MIGNGIPDESSLKNLIEMGYEIHGAAPNCEPRWPEYINEEYHPSDFGFDNKPNKWPGYIKTQRERLKKAKWTSPSGEVKIVNLLD